MLADFKVIGFIPVTDAERARAFYEGVLGLRFRSQDKFALVMEAHGVMIRVVPMERVNPAPYTILGWEVTRLEDVVKALAERGVAFERYPFVKQDEQGIWATPDGSKVAWFRDPDGNTLSVSEHPAR